MFSRDRGFFSLCVSKIMLTIFLNSVATLSGFGSFEVDW